MAKRLPAGMRNNNPGNIKFVGQAGTTPSANLDQGDPQAVFASPEAGMQAMYELLRKKYLGGKISPNMIIAGEGGWTPGNAQAAANVAANAGIGVDDDISFSDPVRAQAFMRALMRQEHGAASDAYTDEQIIAAINSAPLPAPTSAMAAMIAPGVSQGTPGFQPAFGDLVAPNAVETTPIGTDLKSLGLGFIQDAEKKRAREAQDERQRRQALFAQPVAPMASAGLSGLYG